MKNLMNYLSDLLESDVDLEQAVKLTALEFDVHENIVWAELAEAHAKRKSED